MPIIDHLFTEASDAVKESLASLQAVRKSCEDFGKITYEAAVKTNPTVRSELQKSYQRTGLAVVGNWKAKNGDSPGDLYQAWVVKSDIRINMRGVIVYIAADMPGGRHFYERAASFQHGAVHGIAGSKESKSKAAKFRICLKKKIMTQSVRESNKLYGKSTAALPEQLRRDALQAFHDKALGRAVKVGGGVWVQGMRPIYFDSSQVDRITKTFINFINLGLEARSKK